MDCDDVFSDAGSNPAASKTPRFARSFVGDVFSGTSQTSSDLVASTPAASTISPRGNSAAWVCAYRLARVLRSWRRQPFEIAFEISVIDLDEVAALKRIGASLELRAEDFGHDADVPGGICALETAFAQHG